MRLLMVLTLVGISTGFNTRPAARVDDEAERLRFARLAVEATTCGLVCTGLVHADPHEGNLLLTDDGRLAFLDFGLMSVVEPDIMEAFALGIQAVVSKDYVGLVRAFVKTQQHLADCQSKKSESRRSPEVRTIRSTGGRPGGHV